MELLVGDGRPSDLVNPASRAFKALALAIDEISDEQAIDLMAADNSIIRRPVLLNGNQLIVGFDAEVYRTLSG